MTTDPFSVHPQAQNDPLTEQEQAPEPAAAPTAAQTAPGSRQRRNERDVATAVMEKAGRKVASLKKRLDATAASHAQTEGEHTAAVAQCEYASNHPALQD